MVLRMSVAAIVFVLVGILCGSVGAGVAHNVRIIDEVESGGVFMGVYGFRTRLCRFNHPEGRIAYIKRTSGYDDYIMTASCYEDRQVVAGPGMSVSGFGENAVFSGSFKGPFMGDGGHVVFAGEVTGCDDSGNDGMWLFYVLPSGELRPMIQYGDSLPGYPSIAVESVDRVTINSSGQVGFCVDGNMCIYDGSGVSGVIVSGVTEVPRRPEWGGAVPFDYATGYITESGGLVFEGHYKAYWFRIDEGVFRWDNGVVSTIASSGDTDPLNGHVYEAAWLGHASSNGCVVFTTDENTYSADPCEGAIWKSVGGTSYSLVYRGGSPLPGLGEGMPTYFGIGRMAINNNGYVTFRAVAHVDGVEYSGVWSELPGSGLTLIGFSNAIPLVNNVNQVCFYSSHPNSYFATRIWISQADGGATEVLGLGRVLEPSLGVYERIGEIGFMCNASYCFNDNGEVPVFLETASSAAFHSYLAMVDVPSDKEMCYTADIGGTDGIVNVADLAALGNVWLADCRYYCNVEDINSDGTANLLDLGWLSRYWLCDCDER